MIVRTAILPAKSTFRYPLALLKAINLRGFHALCAIRAIAMDSMRLPITYISCGCGIALRLVRRKTTHISKQPPPRSYMTKQQAVTEARGGVQASDARIWKWRRCSKIPSLTTPSTQERMARPQPRPEKLVRIEQMPWNASKKPA